jgi:hypothetical protein
MRTSGLLALTAVAAASLATLGAAAPTRTVHTRAAEVRRIRSHFDSVLVELAARPVATLGTERLARRATLIRALRDYRDRGVFPHNYDFPGRAVPYFVDRQTGTLCAVANLLAFTGRRDIVDRVGRADNNVRVAQLAGDTALLRWLDSNGLTLGEAARIQMPYMVSPPGQAPLSSAQRSRNTAFLIVAPLAIGGSAVSSIWNARGNSDGHRRFANALGLVSGTLTLAVSATSAGKDGIPMAVTAAGAALGSLSIALSTRGIMRHRQLASTPQKPEQPPVAEVSLAPMMPLNGGGAGMTLSLRF